MISFFSRKKKNFDRHPKMVVFRFYDRFWDDFRDSKFFFSQNLIYSYSFLGWNLPGITMSSESLHNYFGITVKSRKNDEKIGFFDFCLWWWNNVGIIATHGNLQWILPQKILWSALFPEKTKISTDIPKWTFSDFTTDSKTLFGNRNFFFLKI